MKKVFTILAIVGMMFFVTASVQAQADNAKTEKKVEKSKKADDGAETKSFHQELKKRFVEGGPAFMGIVLLTLILGLAVAIERIIYLSFADTNTDKLLDEVEGALDEGGVEEAKELLRNKKGPIASIFYEGLERMDEGVDAAEKAVVSYGNVQV